MPSNIYSRYLELDGLRYNRRNADRRRAYKLLHELVNQNGLEFHEVRKLLSQLAHLKDEPAMRIRGWHTICRNARSRIDQWKAGL